MRIISGFLKGKKLDFLKSSITRPVRDFVKENIFNIINHSNLIGIKLKNKNILELYSGIGSFGIECISQGASKSTFVENDRKALSVLKKNLGNLKIENQSKIFDEKIIFFLNRKNNFEKFEIVFFDPPFAEGYFVEDLKMLKNSNILKKKHLIIIHREGKTTDELGKIVNIILTRNYGRSKIIFATF